MHSNHSMEENRNKCFIFYLKKMEIFFKITRTFLKHLKIEKYNYMLEKREQIFAIDFSQTVIFERIY